MPLLLKNWIINIYRKHPQYTQNYKRLTYIHIFSNDDFRIRYAFILKISVKKSAWFFTWVIKYLSLYLTSFDI